MFAACLQVLIPILVFAFVLSGYVELCAYITFGGTTGLFDRYVPLLNGMLVGRDLSCHDAMSLLSRCDICHDALSRCCCDRSVFCCCDRSVFPVVFRLTNTRNRRTPFWRCQSNNDGILKKTVHSPDDLPAAFWFLMRASSEQPIAVCKERNWCGARLFYVAGGIVLFCFPVALTLLVGSYIAYATLVSTFWMLAAVINPTRFLPFAATIATFAGFAFTRWSYVVQLRKLSLTQVSEMVQAAILRRVRASKYVTAIQATRSAMTDSFHANFAGVGPSKADVTSASDSVARLVIGNIVGAAKAMMTDAALLSRLSYGFEPQLHRPAQGGDEHVRGIAAKLLGTSPDIVSLVVAHASGDETAMTQAVCAILNTLFSATGAIARTGAEFSTSCDIANAIIALGMAQDSADQESRLHTFVRVSARALCVSELNIALIDACALALTCPSGYTLAAMARSVPQMNDSSRQLVLTIIQLTQVLFDAYHVPTELLLTSQCVHSALFDVVSAAGGMGPVTDGPRGVPALIRGLAAVVRGDVSAALPVSTLLEVRGPTAFGKARESYSSTITAPMTLALVALGGRRNNSHDMRRATHFLAERATRSSASGACSDTSVSDRLPLHLVPRLFAELCLPLHIDILAFLARAGVGPHVDSRFELDECNNSSPTSEIFEVVSRLQRAEVALLTQGFRADLALHKVDVIGNVLTLLMYPEEERASVITLLKAGAGDKDAMDALFAKLYNTKHTICGEEFDARVQEIFALFLTAPTAVSFSIAAAAKPIGGASDFGTPKHPIEYVFGAWDVSQSRFNAITDHLKSDMKPKDSEADFAYWVKLLRTLPTDTGHGKASLQCVIPPSKSASVAPEDIPEGSGGATIHSRETSQTRSLLDQQNDSLREFDCAVSGGKAGPLLAAMLSVQAGMRNNDHIKNSVAINAAVRLVGMFSAFSARRYRYGSEAIGSEKRGTDDGAGNSHPTPDKSLLTCVSSAIGVCDDLLLMCLELMHFSCSAILQTRLITDIGKIRAAVVDSMRIALKEEDNELALQARDMITVCKELCKDPKQKPDELAICVRRVQYAVQAMVDVDEGTYSKSLAAWSRCFEVHLGDQVSNCIVRLLGLVATISSLDGKAVVEALRDVQQHTRLTATATGGAQSPNFHATAMEELFNKAQLLADILVASGTRERSPPRTTINHTIGLRALLTGLLDFNRAKNFSALLDLALARLRVSRLSGRNLDHPLGYEDDGELSDDDDDGDDANRLKKHGTDKTKEQDIVTARMRSKVFVTAERDIGRLMYLSGKLTSSSALDDGTCCNAAGKRIADKALQHEALAAPVVDLPNLPTLEALKTLYSAAPDIESAHQMMATKLYWRTVVAAAIREGSDTFFYNLSMLGEKVGAAVR